MRPVSKDKTIYLHSDVVALETGENFLSHMGVYYRKVPYEDGTFGAQLTRDPVPGSPAAQIRSTANAQAYRLERGDTIFEIDGQRFRTDLDVRSHRLESTIRFIDVRTGQIMAGSFTLP